MEKAKQAGNDDVVVSLFGEQPSDPPPLTNEEILAIRRMIREFAIIRGTCPMAVRALSTRPLPKQ
jgi:hypothetical protein